MLNFKNLSIETCDKSKKEKWLLLSRLKSENALGPFWTRQFNVIYIRKQFRGWPGHLITGRFPKKFQEKRILAWPSYTIFIFMISRYAMNYKSLTEFKNRSRLLINTRWYRGTSLQNDIEIVASNTHLSLHVPSRRAKKKNLWDI